MNFRVCTWLCSLCLLSAGVSAAWAGAAESPSPPLPGEAAAAAASKDDSDGTNSTRLMIRKLMETNSAPPGGATGGQVKRSPTTRPASWPPTATQPAPKAPAHPAGGPGKAAPATRPPRQATLPQPTTRPAPSAKSASAKTPAPAKASATTRPAGAGATTKPAPPRHLASGEEVIPQTVVEQLAKLRKMPDVQLDKSVRAADRLYAGGHYQSALVFYEIALRNETGAQMRAWLLYQTGNCHRHKNPDEAVAAYKKMIQEFPDCPWAPAAAMTSKLLQWHKVNQPQKFIKSLESNKQQ